MSQPFHKRLFPAIYRRIRYPHVFIKAGANRIKIAALMIGAYITKLPETKCYTGQAFLNHIKKNRLSFIRWGDGETKIFHGMNVGTKNRHVNPKNGRTIQESSMKLREKIKSLLVFFENHKSEDILFCIPFESIKSLFAPCLHQKARQENYTFYQTFNELFIWSESWALLKKIIKKQPLLGDSMVPREALRENLNMEQLWKDEKNVILLHSKKWVAEEFKNKNVFFLKVPGRNAFRSYDKLKNDTLKIIKKNKLNRENSCLVICAGPLAKVLIFELHQEIESAPVCYDLGRFFEIKRLEKFDL